MIEEERVSDVINSGRLTAFVERIERLEEEKKSLGQDIKEVYAEAKGVGYDVKILRDIIAERKLDEDERRERDALFATYAKALGMYADTPLGKATVESEVADAKGGKRAKAGRKAEVVGELRKAVSKLGKPVALTEDEKRKGQIAAFEGCDGTRMSISTNVPVGRA